MNRATRAIAVQVGEVQRFHHHALAGKRRIAVDKDRHAANSLGTTIDFGKGALVVSCVSPADIAKLSVSAQGAGKPTMTAQQYMDYMVAQSAGAMTATPVGGVTDYLDFGNGKEDGLGSTATATSVRLDAWVANKFIILTFIHPATTTPSSALLNFIKTTHSVL